jgi:hypothetical protein
MSTAVSPNTCVGATTLATSVTNVGNVLVLMAYLLLEEVMAMKMSWDDVRLPPAPDAAAEQSYLCCNEDHNQSTNQAKVLCHGL